MAAKNHSTTPKHLPDFDLVLFGGTGDLAMRKLLPALFRRYVAGLFPRPGPHHQRRAQQHRARRLSGAGRAEQPESPAAGTGCDALDGVQPHAWTTLDWTRPTRRTTRSSRPGLPTAPAPVRVFFLSTAPALFATICRNLAAANLVTPGARVVLEKPLGHDRASAEHINENVGAIFPERQIYRIDHYLGKEAVQNLLALRFGNALFEPLWRRGRISHVQITVAEELGRRGRAASSTTRPARCATWCRTTCCSCCASWRWSRRCRQRSRRRARREAQGAALAAPARRRATSPRNVVRGQYKAGAVNGTPVRRATSTKQGIPPDSRTETFVALKAEIDTWRWAGVPFYLRTGKRLAGAGGRDRDHTSRTCRIRSSNARPTGSRQPAGDLAAAATTRSR